MRLGSTVACKFRLRQKAGEQNLATPPKCWMLFGWFYAMLGIFWLALPKCLFFCFVFLFYVSKTLFSPPDFFISQSNSPTPHHPGSTPGVPDLWIVGPTQTLPKGELSPTYQPLRFAASSAFSKLFEDSEKHQKKTLEMGRGNGF